MGLITFDTRGRNPSKNIEYLPTTRSIHDRRSNHKRLSRLNSQALLIHHNPPVANEHAILQILQRRIGNEEGVRASFFSCAPHGQPLPVSTYGEVEQRARVSGLTGVTEGDGGHVGVHVEDFRDFGGHFDDADVAEVDGVTLFGSLRHGIELC